MAEVGEREKKDCPAAEGKGMTKYSPTLRQIEPCTLWGEWGEPKLSQKVPSRVKAKPDFGGKTKLERNNENSAKIVNFS